LVAIFALVWGAALVFRFSWSRLAERVGAALDDLVDSARARRACEEDMQLGQQAVREREEVVLEERLQTTCPSLRR